MFQMLIDLSLFALKLHFAYCVYACWLKQSILKFPALLDLYRSLQKFHFCNECKHVLSAKYAKYAKTTTPY